MPEVAKTQNVPDQSTLLAQNRPGNGFAQADLIRSEIYKPFGVVPIPYGFFLGGVNIVGIMYCNIATPEDSWTEGVFAGAVIGRYLLSKENEQACAKDPFGVVAEVCVKLDFKAKKIQGKICHPYLDCHAWPPHCETKYRCSGWETIVSW
jgi:hypothetical protein